MCTTAVFAEDGSKDANLRIEFWPKETTDMCLIIWKEKEVRVAKILNPHAFLTLDDHLFILHNNKLIECECHKRYRFNMEKYKRAEIAPGVYEVEGKKNWGIIVTTNGGFEMEFFMNEMRYVFNLII